MATVSLTLDDLIEEALDHLYRPTGRPFQTVVGSNDLSTAADTTLTLAQSDQVGPTTVLEFPDGELVLVTSVTDDVVPVLTVSRGYSGTTAAAHSAGEVVVVGPAWPLHEVERWVTRFFTGPANRHIPNLVSAVLNRVADKQYVQMPASTMRVFEVRYMDPTTGRMVDLGGWRFEDRVPVAAVATGKLLRVASIVHDDDDLLVTYQAPYEFSGGVIDVPVGAEDLPALWAAAFGLMRRELTRTDLDSVEEWNQDQAVRQGVSLRTVRELWGEFYRRLDEVKSMQNVPRHRPFRRMPRI